VRPPPAQLLYVSTLAPEPPADAARLGRTAADAADRERGERLARALLVPVAVLGGAFTSNVGSGSDIALYAFGLLGWNMLVPDRAFSDNELTACSGERHRHTCQRCATARPAASTPRVASPRRRHSASRARALACRRAVVAMGMLSLLSALCRALSGAIGMRSYLCFGACAWLVPFGAPLGSLLLTPRLQSVLRAAFYLLALAQFAGFAILRVRGDRGAWELLFVITAAVLGMLLVHRTARRRRKYAVACR
jgi:hypothetical protein